MFPVLGKALNTFTESHFSLFALVNLVKNINKPTVLTGTVVGPCKAHTVFNDNVVCSITVQAIVHLFRSPLSIHLVHLHIACSTKVSI